MSDDDLNYFEGRAQTELEMAQRSETPEVTVIVIPDTQTREKKDMLRLAGAELVEVPAVPYANENNYVKMSARLAQELSELEPNGAVWANQFDNIANRQAHVETTGPEIWEETGGKVDGFVCAVGTGGTLAGVSIALKERNPALAVALADPPGAALFSYYTTGQLRSEGNSITEGIGQGRITSNLEGFTPDFSFHISATMACLRVALGVFGLAFHLYREPLSLARPMRGVRTCRWLRRV